MTDTSHSEKALYVTNFALSILFYAYYVLVSCYKHERNAITIYTVVEYGIWSIQVLRGYSKSLSVTQLTIRVCGHFVAMVTENAIEAAAVSAEYVALGVIAYLMSGLFERNNKTPRPGELFTYAISSILVIPKCIYIITSAIEGSPIDNFDLRISFQVYVTILFAKNIAVMYVNFIGQYTLYQKRLRDYALITCYGIVVIWIMAIYAISMLLDVHSVMRDVIIAWQFFQLIVWIFHCAVLTSMLNTDFVHYSVIN